MKLQIDTNFSKHKKNYYKYFTLNTLTKLHESPNREDAEECNDIIEQKQKCGICLENLVKYTCPKCRIKYCNVACYKTHNLDCTEEFYKNSVIQDLKANKVDDFEATKFRQKLQKFNSKLNEEDEVQNSSEIREKHLKQILTKLEEDTFDIETDLTAEDWKEFNQFINGEAQKEISQSLWKPFWIRSQYEMAPSLLTYELPNYDAATLENIKNLDVNSYKEYLTFSEEAEEENILDRLCDIDLENAEDMQEIKINNRSVPVTRSIIELIIILKYNAVPLLEKLTSVSPSEKNSFVLCYLILTACYSFKLFNGEFYNKETAEVIFDLAPVLYNKNILFLNEEDAKSEFYNKLAKYEPKYLSQTKEMLEDDLTKILSNKFYIFETVVRLYECIHITNNKWTKFAKQKLIYYMSYIKQHI